MTRPPSAAILRILAPVALAVILLAVACQRPGQGMAQVREGPGAPPGAARTPFEAFLNSLPPSPPGRLDAQQWRTVRRFYGRRGFEPAWVARGETLDRANSLLLALEQAGREGLDPADYPTRDLAARLDRIGENRRATDAERYSLDLEFTEAFIHYASDLSMGRLGPSEVEQSWHIPLRVIDLEPALERATTTEDPRAVLEGLAPKQPPYRRLREALVRYNEIARSGGWPQIPGGPTLHPGDRAPVARIEALEARLAREGFPAHKGEANDRHAPGASELYGASFADVVRAFQRRHGLEPDGVVGSRTLAALNVPASMRVRQIELNMVRWRRVPEEPGGRLVLVNIPGFRLEIWDHERLVTRMKVIVGLEGWRTPIFHAHIEQIILHPAWNVPTSIALREILPKIRRNPGYLAAHHMDMISLGRGFRIRQRPGPDNPLGRFKFLLPNPYDVYLHDTASPSLFEKEKRALSHGCIRVERPMDLALWILAPDPTWTRERVERALTDPSTQHIHLIRDVPVYVSYGTAVANEDGSTDFYPDLYGYDADLDARLRALRPQLRSAGAPAVATGRRD